MEHRPRAATMTPPNGTPVAAAPSWLALEPDPVSAKTARVFTRTLLVEDPRELVDDVEMVVDELVTNAIVHAPDGYVVPPGISPLIHLALLPMRRWVVIEVRDPWPDIPCKRETGDAAEGGRGLEIVHALAARCWTNRGAADKTVRAIVTRPGARVTDAELDRLRRS